MKKFFSQHSGQVYEVSDEEASLLDLGQIPLLGEPKANCRHCFGRGYVYKETISNVYVICRCTAKHIDLEAYKKKVADFKALKNDPLGVI